MNIKMKLLSILVAIFSIAGVANTAQAQVRAKVVIGGHRPVRHYYARPHYGYRHDYYRHRVVRHDIHHYHR